MYVKYVIVIISYTVRNIKKNNDLLWHVFKNSLAASASEDRAMGRKLEEKAV